jgi:phosphohistidine phosphatase
VSVPDAAERRKLWVLRHAKATSGSPDGQDHSRALTKKGRAQAQATARHSADLRRSGVPVPRVVVSSSARRAVQTAEIVVEGLDEDVTLEVNDDLYQADPDEVLEVLSRLDDGLRSVMVVGHNPTLAELVELLLSEGEHAASERGDVEPGARELSSFPTCALARLSVPAESWGSVEEGSARLEELFVPAV